MMDHLQLETSPRRGVPVAANNAASPKKTKKFSPPFIRLGRTNIDKLIKLARALSHRSLTEDEMLEFAQLKILHANFLSTYPFNYELMYRRMPYSDITLEGAIVRASQTVNSENNWTPQLSALVYAMNNAIRLCTTPM